MNDRKKAEYDRLHRQEMRITGAEPSLFRESEWCLKYVTEQCTNAAILYKGPSITFTYTGVSKHDMFQAQELIDDAQRALDDPKVHPQLGFAWVGQHKSEAYKVIKATREGLYFARSEVEKMHVISVESLINQAWDLYRALNHDTRLSSTKPRDVFAKLKETQNCIAQSYLKKPTRNELRDKVDTLWKLVQEFIGESQRLWEERQRNRAARDAAREENQREWRERQVGHIGRWQSRINNSSEFIGRLLGQIAELEVKKATARSGDFADRVQGWIDEKYEKITEVRAEILELQTRIDDVKQRLNESRG